MTASVRRVDAMQCMQVDAEAVDRNHRATFNSPRRHAPQASPVEEAQLVSWQIA